MTATRETTLVCDEEHCITTIRGVGAPTKVRIAAARSAGWSYRSGYDFCPDHSDAVNIEDDDG